MPPARLPNRHEEIQNGEFVFLQHGVEYGDDGVKNLKHFVPMAQNEWHHFLSATHHRLVRVHETVTSRIMTRMIACEGGAKTSKMMRRILLPKDFGSFPVSGLSVISRRSSNVTSFSVTLWKSGVADLTIDNISIFPISENTFEAFSFTPAASYSPGDFASIEIKIQTSGRGAWAEVGDISLAYVTARGNV